MSDRDGGVVAVREVAQPVVSVVPDLTDRRAISTNLDLSTKKGAVALVNSATEGDLSFGEGGVLLMDMAYYVISVEEYPDEETGELRRGPRTVLIDPKGKTFVTTSAYVPLAMNRIVQSLAAGGLTLPVKVQLRERRSRKSKRTYHELRLIP
jgi:hypothetical protein